MIATGMTHDLQGHRIFLVLQRVGVSKALSSVYLANVLDLIRLHWKQFG